MKNFYFLLIAAAVFASASFSSCKSGRTITKAIAPRDTTAVIVVNNSADSIRAVDETRALINDRNIDFKTFSAKIKMDIEDSKGKKPDLVAVVRIIKDSAIWVSISATILNIEVYRALLTPDSVILMNKQDKEVQYRSLGYIQEITEIPFDFKTLQDLLIGNPVFYDPKNVTVKNYEGFTSVQSTTDRFKNLLTLNKPQRLLERSKLDDVDPLRNRTADFTYSDYQEVNGKFFSTKRQIVIAEKNRIDIRMDFKQYEFNKELSVQFNVPKNYTKK